MNEFRRFYHGWVLPDRSILLFCAILLIFAWSGAWWLIDHDLAVSQAGVPEEVLAYFFHRHAIYLAVAGGVSLFIIGFAGYIIAIGRKQRQNDTWLRTFVTNTPIIFYALDPHGNFILSEGLGLKKLGLQAGEVVGRSALAMYRDYPDILDAIRRSTKGEAVFFEHKVGEAYFNNRLVPVFDETGKVKTVVGATVDITDRVLAERLRKESFEELTAMHEELVAAEEELRTNYVALKNERAFSEAVLESVPGLLYLYDAEGRLVRWNKNHMITTGYSDEDLKKITLADWFKGDPETVERLTGEITKVLRSGGATAEAELIGMDDGKKSYQFTAVKTIIDDTPYFVGIGIDISDRKKAEAALQKNLAELTATHEELLATEEELRAQYDELDMANRELVGQNTILEALRETTASLMSQTSLDQLLKAIVAGATASTGTPHGNIALLNEQETAMESLGGLGLFAALARIELSTDQGIIGQVCRTGQPVVIKNYNRWGNRLPLPALDEIRCFVQVPLKRGDKVIGVIGVAFTNEDYQFGAMEQAFLNRFGELASIAVENTRKVDELQRSQKMAMDIFNAAGDGLVVNDGETGEILAANRRAQEMFGYSEKELKEQGIVLISTVANMEAALQVIRATVREGPQPLYEREARDCMGRRLVLEISPTPVEIDGKIRCMASMRDITARKRMEEGLEYLHQHDPLTGAYNRGYFETGLIRMQAGKHSSVGIFVCDVDGLKLINDTLGHRHGDKLLKQVAGLLVTAVKEPNYAARIGGDEFAVVLPDATRRQMEELARYYRRQVEAYNDENPHLPLSLSLGWALGAENAKVESVFRTADHNMYRQKMHQSKSVRGSLVRLVMKALEARDHITEGHADRLSKLMEMMGHSLMLPQDAISDLRLLAKFHDIGKVGIPDSILKKPGKLTADEMNIMRQHCEIGFRIAKSSPDLEPVADWILRHHEYWDGKGYPFGIKGEEIPIQCRILSIVDAYDAMTSDRPYRKAMPPEDARAEICRCSGTQFDPTIVEKFLKSISVSKN